MLKLKRGPVGKFLHSDRLFDIINLIIMLLLVVIFVYPLWFVLISSVSNPMDVWNGKVTILPSGFTLDSYKAILNYKNIWIGYRNTIFYTVAGTAINIIMTICAAYPLSRKDFAPRNFLMAMLMVTMYFSGGLIPNYLVVQKLGLINTVWAILIPGAVSVSNVIITRTYFAGSIPESLREAAQLDGANIPQYLIKVVLPLSKPILAVIALYYAVGHWNEFFNAMIYLRDTELLPLQSFLRNILITGQVDLDVMGAGAAEAAEKMQMAETLKYGVIVVASVPLLCIYPRLQKYFVKGVMIGSVKG